jgi:hypothetical protein
MSARALSSVALFGSIVLSSCASPYFIHDPRTLVVDREEVPRLLKSLRCELITFIAANNQRNILFVAETKAHGIRSAEELYQYYEIDPRRFGVVNLTLQVQDSAGIGSGTQIDHLWTHDGGVHTHFLDVGPTIADVSQYAATWNFALPQDAIVLRAAPQPEPDESSYSCYSEIPKRASPPFGSSYAEEDLDALARNDFPDYPLFKRVWVNNNVPLAGWLQEVGNSITRPTLGWHTPQQKASEMIPAQMVYQFSVTVTGGLDVKYGLTSPAWPILGVEALAGVQKTNTIQIYLNGIEANDWYNAQFGNTINNDAKPLPKIKVAGPQQPTPTYVGRERSRGRPEWTPVITGPPGASRH